MRSQVINMVGYAGDITTAKSRLGIYSALIMVKGGSSDTAIKVVTCSTSDGSFEDYATLASAGASDLIAGYYVDLSGADKYIKVTGATYADVVFGDCDFDPKGITASGSVPSETTVQSLSVTKNGTYTASSGYAYSPVVVAVTLYAYGDSSGVVYLAEIPSEDGEVDVYVPSATGLATADGTYEEETGVTVDDVAYARYEDGDIVI